MVHEPVHRGGVDLPVPLVVSGRHNAHLVPRLTGYAEVALGLIWWVVAVGAVWWVTTAFAPLSPQQVARSWVLLGCSSLDVAVIVAMALTWWFLGCLHLLDAWHLKRIRLVIDNRGIAREDGRRFEVPWERVRHVAVTSGSRNARRLLVDHGAVPESWWWRQGPVRPKRAYLRLLPGRRGFAVNVRIDMLDPDAATILNAIRYFSGGRFPDR
jgi:hypothetical protein